jgi:prostaglandin reductase 1
VEAEKMVRAQKFIMLNKFKGEVALSDIKLENEDLPPLKEHEVLLEAIYWSVDPYMRPYMTRFPEGTTIIGGQVAK